ncbi:MAG: winged helix-turn-helix transcriptional regulator [Nanoarchaeota archaeon]
MENRRLGIVLVVISLVVLTAFFSVNTSLASKAQELGCYTQPNCLPLEKNFSFIHIGIGVFSFLLSLGAYLLFFNKTERAILEKLEDEKRRTIEEGKFESFLKGLDSFEQKVVKIVRDQPGITQSLIQIKTDMSKAKLSYVLQDLEKRGIIKRVEKGKTLAVYLKV